MKHLFSILLCCCSAYLCAQNGPYSQIGPLNLTQTITPPYLEIVNLQFVDVTGNNAIDAREVCKLVFDVSNTGSGNAIGCVATIIGEGTTTGITFNNKPLPPIAVGGSLHVEIPITASEITVDGSVQFTLQITEPNQFNSAKQLLAVETSAFHSPYLVISDNAVSSDQSDMLIPSKPFTLQAKLHNRDKGLAENVVVQIDVPKSVFVMKGSERTEIDTLRGGDVHLLEYQLVTSEGYVDDIIPITLHIREKHGIYAEDKTINLKINQEFASRITVEKKEDAGNIIRKSTIGSAVDKAPHTSANNTNTFAFILANEHYRNGSFSDVQYAINDGKTFREYCRHTLGIPENNIMYKTDATFGDMVHVITRMKQAAEVNKNSHIIFYYAGHGAPSENTLEALLIPIDAFQIMPQTCYSLQTLYDELRTLEHSRVTVFLDACFSGNNRENKVLLADARGVAIVPKKNNVEGNLVVFSASSGSETAWPYKTEEHGLFTYYLLKKLQETRGNATYEELQSYIYEEVRRTSNNENGKIQTPTVSTSVSLGNTWKKWKLR